MSFLIGLRVYFLIYSTVCHVGRRTHLLAGLMGIDRLLHGHFSLNEAEGKGGSFCEVQVGSPEQSGVLVTALLGTCDEAGIFEIIERTEEGSLGKHGAVDEQFAPGEDGCQGIIGRYGTSEGGENGSGAKGESVNAFGAKSGAKRDPTQIGGIGLVGASQRCSVGERSSWFIRVSVTLASNEALRDRHNSVHFSGNGRRVA